MVLKIKNVCLVVYFAVSRDTYSCKLLRSTRVSASFFLRAFSSLSSLLCVFSASRCSLVKLFTAGKKLHRRLKKKKKRLLRMREETHSKFATTTNLARDESFTPSTIALSTKAER